LSNRNPTKMEVRSGATGGVCISWSTSCTGRVSDVDNPVISNEWEHDEIVITTNWSHLWSPATQTVHNDQPSHQYERIAKYVRGIVVVACQLDLYLHVPVKSMSTSIKDCEFGSHQQRDDTNFKVSSISR
jgi:hypothetical protein